MQNNENDKISKLSSKILGFISTPTKRKILIIIKRIPLSEVKEVGIININRKKI